jgi:hypothetical protein
MQAVLTDEWHESYDLASASTIDDTADGDNHYSGNSVEE